MSHVSLQAATFNVVDYGAVGDDSTDNTAAFSACLNAVIAAGGGQMYLPDGVYRGKITIPPVTNSIPSWMAIEIVGQSEPVPVWGTIGSFPLRQKGTIIKSLATSGPAVISAASCPPATSLYDHFSAVHVILRNLDVRTYNNPQIGGIDLYSAMQCRLDNVVINTGVYNVQASLPTHGTKGLITPANSNAALTILRNVLITGYHTGIVANEHTDGDNITLGSNLHGIEFVAAFHASRFGRVCAQRCTNAITVTGAHPFTIEQLDIEKTGPGQTDANNVWQANAFDINDPSNLGTADLDYWVVVGNVGAVDNFTRNGGANVKARRIGSSGTTIPPAASGINGSFESPDTSAVGYQEIPVGSTVGGWIHRSGTFSAWIVRETHLFPQFPEAAEGAQMLEFDHRSAPNSLIYRSIGTTAYAGNVKVSAKFALRNFNASPLPNAAFKLLLLSGTPGNFTTLADSGLLTHSSVAMWVNRSLTATNVPTGTPVFVGFQANFFGTPTNHVFTLVDDVRVSIPTRFGITKFDYTPGKGAVALTWNSQPTGSYRVMGSTGLTGWNYSFGTNIGTAQDQIPNDGNKITHTFNLNSFLLQNQPKMFFRVEDEAF